jgi:fumarate reductase subunit C
MTVAEAGRFWWLRKFRYISIFLRELSSVFILAYVLLYLWLLPGLRSGSTNSFSQLGTAPFLALSFAMLAFSLYHSITWFSLLGRAQPIKLGGIVLQGRAALFVNLAILAAVSLILATLVYGVNIRLGVG